MPETGGTTYVEVDDDGRYLDAHPDALELFGVSLDELRRHRVGDFARPGFGPIHWALFLFVVRSGRDFGGGESTLVTADGRETAVACPSIEKLGDRYRVHLTVLSKEPGEVQTRALASVLDAWREAERHLAKGDWLPDYDAAEAAAKALADVYKRVSATKGTVTNWVSDHTPD